MSVLMAVFPYVDGSILGPMFQLLKSQETRRVASEHYTLEKNILKTIGSLFLDEYRSRADRLMANKSTRATQFDVLLDETASNIYCDPAFMRKYGVSCDSRILYSE